MAHARQRQVKQTSFGVKRGWMQHLRLHADTKPTAARSPGGAPRRTCTKAARSIACPRPFAAPCRVDLWARTSACLAVGTATDKEQRCRATSDGAARAAATSTSSTLARRRHSAARACGRRFWVERSPLAACPRCGGALRLAEERRRETKAGYASRKEAQAALNTVLVAVAERRYVSPSKETLEQFLTNRWLPAIEATVRLTTYRSYVQHVEWHIAPHLGAVPLQSLSGAQINALYGKLARSGRRGGSSGLSSLTIRHVHAVLHRALKDAVRWGVLTRNPIAAADPPRITHGREMKTWSAAELEAFLTFTQDDRLHALWQLLALSGMRRGEACGLRWCDCDLAEGRIAIRRALVPIAHTVLVSEPKTAHGRRSIALDERTVAVLQAHASGRQMIARKPRRGLTLGSSSRVLTGAHCRPTR